MGKYRKSLFILFVISLFLLIDNVSALSFSSVSNRVTYSYMDGTYINKDFYPDNTWILPGYVNSSMGDPYIQLYQFRYTVNSNFTKTRSYTLKINLEFKNFNSGGGTIDLSQFRSALPLQDFGCGTNYSNSTPNNLTLISNDFNYSNTNGTVDLTIKFRPKVDTCNFLSGIFYHESNNNNYAIINNYYTADSNSRLVITPSYVETAETSDIISNDNQNTQDVINNNNNNTNNIIDNQNQNTQDIIDNQNKNNESIIDNQNELLGKKCPNLFSKSNIAIGGFVADGGIVDNTSLVYTDYYIEVSPNTKYTFSSSDSVERLVIVEYNSNKGFIQRDLNLNSSTYTITTTANTRFVRLNSVNSAVDNLQFEKGSSRTSYCEYGSYSSKLDDVTSGLGSINDSLTDSSSPDTSGLADAPGWLPPGPVDSIVTLPINLLQSLTNNLESACNPINLPLPFVDSNLTIACPATLLKKIDGFWMFWESFGLIAGVWILYKYFINLYKWVESHLSMDEKESLGKWGGV